MCLVPGCVTCGLVPGRCGLGLPLAVVAAVVLVGLQVVVLCVVEDFEIDVLRFGIICVASRNQCRDSCEGKE
jgi:hypothetical protein